MRRPLPALLGSAGLIAVGLTMFNVAHADAVSFTQPTYSARLLGTNEVPAVTTSSTGTATVTIDEGARRVCATLTLQGLPLANVTAMHVHKGAAGANGPVVVPFTVAAQSCAENVAADVIAAIVDNPSGHYFNVHTSANPGGEIRGQLSVPAPPTPPTTTQAPTTSAPRSTTTTTPADDAPVPVTASPRFTG